jgi:hypothetical protein
MENLGHTARLMLGITWIFVIILSTYAYAQPSKMFFVNIVAKDLCGRRITSIDDENATLVLTFTTPDGSKFSFVAGLSPNGTTFFMFQLPSYVPGIDKEIVPGTILNISLYFKGVLIEPVSGPGPIVLGNQSGNLKLEYVFPVGDLYLRPVLADTKEPLANVTVALNFIRYVSWGWKYTEKPKLTNNSGIAAFSKIPLAYDSRSQIVVVVKTSKFTPYIKHPQDENHVIANWNLSDLLKARNLQLTCSMGPVDVLTTFLSFTGSMELVEHLRNESLRLQQNIATLQKNAEEKEKVATALFNENIQLKKQIEELKLNLSQLQTEVRSLQVKNGELEQQLRATQNEANIYKLVALLSVALLVLALLLVKRKLPRSSVSSKT